MSEKTYAALVERVKRKTDDSAEDWAQLLSDLGTVENVTMTHLRRDGQAFTPALEP